MELITGFVDFFLHLDKHLTELIAQYGGWTYGILFAIVFCETGLVVTPILPGDSLLFAAGSLAALGSLRMEVMVPLLIAACLLGDLVNYGAGKFLGAKLFSNPNARFLKKDYLDRTHRFYERYGAKTIIIARFVPIVRTFAPFVAGMGTMRFSKYIGYCIAGAVLWVGACSTLGFLFGNIPIVKKNFTLVILGIIFVSLLPAIIGFLKEKKAAASAARG